jgi:hypothetical protein
VGKRQELGESSDSFHPCGAASARPSHDRGQTDFVDDQQRRTSAPNVQRRRLRSNLSRDTWLSRRVRVGVPSSAAARASSLPQRRKTRLAIASATSQAAPTQSRKSTSWALALGETRLPLADRARDRQPCGRGRSVRGDHGPRRRRSRRPSRPGSASETCRAELLLAQEARLQRASEPARYRHSHHLCSVTPFVESDRASLHARARGIGDHWAAANSSVAICWKSDTPLLYKPDSAAGVPLSGEANYASLPWIRRSAIRMQSRA